MKALQETKESGNAKVNESVNEVSTSSVNPFNFSEMFKLEINFNAAEETAAISNLPALERICELANNAYYFVMQPKNNRKGNAYMWIKATKQGEDREEFALYVNEDVLNVVVSILTGKTANISGVNADNLEDFNKKIQNFEYVLFRAEKEQGRTMKKTYSTTGQTYSSYYKRGVITYKPYLNPELKAYLVA
ncbi:MAG: hypothetical protein LBI82_06480 [Dysgonamonadaceae bacterium]|jgi:hypothetical protein|nr:hypothetical protein [Dysgonamonadaceae bacterium]